MNKRWVSVLVAVTVVTSVFLPGSDVARADPVQTVAAAGGAEAAARGTTAGVAVLDRATGRYADNGGDAHLRFGSASLVKLFIADSVLRRARLGQLGLGPADRNALGVMLRSSDDAAASSLWSRFGGSGIVTDVAGRYGLAETAPPANPRYWGLTQVTAHDLVVFYDGLLAGRGGLAAADRDFIVDQLRQATVTGTDGVRQFFGLRDGLPREPVIGIKQGWMCCFSDGYTWRHSTGIVGPDARYVVVALARDQRSMGAAHTVASSTGIVQRMFPAGFVPRVQGLIGDLWYRMGGHRSRLGLPTTSELPLPAGAVSWFEHGCIYWSPRTGTHFVTGAILGTYRAAGYETGPLGYPTSDEIALPGGALSTFQGGYVYWSPPTGAQWVKGAILTAYAGQGYETGVLGYPTSNEIPLRGGAGSRFQGGNLYWSPRTGAHWVIGSILGAYRAHGYENGVLGYPTSDEIRLPGGALSRFTGGYVYWSRGAGAHAVRGSVLAAYRAQGYETGPLGYPTSDQVLLPGGSVTRFRGGNVYASPGNGTHAVTGALLAAYRAQGYETGALGYPTSDPYAVGNATRIDFEHGALTLGADGQVVLGSPSAGQVLSGQAAAVPTAAAPTGAAPTGAAPTAAAPTGTVPDPTAAGAPEGTTVPGDPAPPATGLAEPAGAGPAEPPATAPVPSGSGGAGTP